MSPALHGRAASRAIAGGLALLAFLALPQPVRGTQEDGPETLRAVVRSTDGPVTFEFAARPGVWGDGRTWNVGFEEASPGTRCPGCTNGPIRITVQVNAGRETTLRSRVGGVPGVDPEHVALEDGRARNLGEVDPSTAAAYLLDLVERERPLMDGESKEEALQAAVSARGVRTEASLLRIARDRQQVEDVRKAALFWAAHEAGARAANAIEEVAVADDEETEVQEAAVFALSRLPGRRGTDALLRVARENRNPEIVRTTYFWLGQTDDPRALALFEEILSD